MSAESILQQYNPDQLALDICALFGIDTSSGQVVDVTLKMRAHEIPTLTVKYSLWERGKPDVVTVLRSYELRESAIPTPCVPIEENPQCPT